MTGERVGVGHDPSRGAAYVEGWIAALEEDPREIRRAAADSQKISDFVLSRQPRARGRARTRGRGRDPRGRAGADRPSRAAAPRAAADLRAAPLTVGEEPGDVRPHGRTGPADRRATQPQSLPHAGRPPPRIRREPGPRVHLLPRTVRARARRHRRLRRRLVPRSRRGPLRRPSLHHPAGRERLGTRRARHRDHGHRTRGATRSRS